MQVRGMVHRNLESVESRRYKIESCWMVERCANAETCRYDGDEVYRHSEAEVAQRLDSLYRSKINRSFLRRVIDHRPPSC